MVDHGGGGAVGVHLEAADVIDVTRPSQLDGSPLPGQHRGFGALFGGTGETLEGDVVFALQRIVLADGIPLNLTKKEFEILVFLARNKNRVVTKESIAEHLWGDYMEDAISFDFIYAHVKNLRKKLAAHGYSEYLKTVYGVGYKFEVV